MRKNCSLFNKMQPPYKPDKIALLYGWNDDSFKSVLKTHFSLSGQVILLKTLLFPYSVYWIGQKYWFAFVIR